MWTRLSTVPASVIALPFLLARSQGDDLEWTVRTALAAAIAAERAVDGERRNTRSRLAWLLCEFGYQLSRRGLDTEQDLPISRAQLAEALGTSLCRVKRALALFALSGIARSDGRTLQILDWSRLCSVGGYERDRLELLPDDPDDGFASAMFDERPQQLLTTRGEPACFV